MPTLLFEIGCEELPASACREAEAQLPELCRHHLGAEPGNVYIGPRRLTVVVDDLPERTPDEVRRGPAERIAFDDGEPTKAAEGFARGLGLTVAELERRDGHVWGTMPGVALAGVLPERLAEVVRALAFGKSMRWGPELRFSRPVRWLLATLDGEVLDVPVEGVPCGGVSYGHRFRHPGPVDIADGSEYAERVRAAGVEPDAGARRDAILAELDAIGGWSDPGGVLEEVVYLVESPLVLTGTFSERFLALPERVVVTAMQSHQRYFPLGGARFAFVANGGDPELVRAGNERVLEGRLEDASFTFERDVSRGIDELARELGAITFVAGAGSMADKTARLERLVDALGGRGCVPRGGAALQGRSGGGAGAGVPRSGGSHRRRVRAAGRLPRGGLPCDRGAVPPRLCRRPAARHGAGPRARRGREGRQPRRCVLAGRAALGHARPVRPPAGGDRPLPPGAGELDRGRRRRADSSCASAARRAGRRGARRSLRTTCTTS